jgi:N-acetylmuramoyl-L-alanine amidase
MSAFFSLISQYGLLFGFVASLVCSSNALGTPLVMLDPGHGGKKPGAETAEGAFEKDIVLGVAEVAAAHLRKSKVHVQFTRASDLFLSLTERRNIANEAGADALVSIHANFSDVVGRRGVETYVLSPDTDASSQAIADRENASEDPSEIAMGGSSDSSHLASILGDMHESHAHQQSARLAAHVQRALGGVGPLQPSRGLRQAPFKVLQGAQMAAILVELGYLSHKEQGGYLASRAGQRETGAALASGILAFLRRFEKK